MPMLSIDNKPSLKTQERSLAGTLKAVHYNLRVRTLELGDAALAWAEHVDDQSGRQEYARCMSALAETESWQSDDNNRFVWCRKTAMEYYKEGLLVRVLEKEKRREKFESALKKGISRESIDPRVNVSITWDTRGPWRLLDVGACFNGFSSFDEFTVDGIDLTPGHPTVKECDFLNVQVSSAATCLANTTPGEPITHLPEHSYDIVAFCLLLSYLPSPSQRLQCLITAHGLLVDNGLLLVITPDSNHQGKGVFTMKNWKKVMEAIGFERVKYFKHPHLHCMGFRKLPDGNRTTPSQHTLDRLSPLLAMAQDISQDGSNDSGHEPSGAALLDVVL